MLQYIAVSIYVATVAYGLNSGSLVLNPRSMAGNMTIESFMSQVQPFEVSNYMLN